MTYVHQTQLDDAAKPYRRVYLCEATGIYAKVHANRRSVGFGKAKWEFTGSLSDETGKALRDDAGAVLIHIEPAGLSVFTDRGIKQADARDLLAELIAAETEEEVELIKRRARLLFESPPTQQQLQQAIADDFEAACRFMVAKVERAELIRREALNFGGVKAA